MYASETSKHRDVVAAYCTGYGLDIGFGGDPVTPASVRVDMRQPYAHTGAAPVQLGGDCRDLYWFQNDALDYVYSSHVLEDFSESETEPVMREWTRVIRPSGSLILLLPDQARYVEHCKNTGQPHNFQHSVDHFSLEYVLGVAERIGNLNPAAQHPYLGEYSFAVVFTKTAASSAASVDLAELRAQLEVSREKCLALSNERDELTQRLERIERDRAYQLASKARRILRRG